MKKKKKTPMTVDTSAVDNLEQGGGHALHHFCYSHMSLCWEGDLKCDLGTCTGPPSAAMDTPFKAQARALASDLEVVLEKNATTLGAE